MLRFIKLRRLKNSRKGEEVRQNELTYKPGPRKEFSQKRPPNDIYCVAIDRMLFYGFVIMYAMLVDDDCDQVFEFGNKIQQILTRGTTGKVSSHPIENLVRLTIDFTHITGKM
jgi:hypothetical protein